MTEDRDALVEALRIARIVQAGIEDAQCRRTASESCAALIAHLEASILPPTTSAGDALALARRFHETYERLAPDFGYETRLDTKAFDPNSSNGRLMTAVCAAIFPPSAGDGELVERLSKLAKSNLETMREQVRRCDRWCKSHHELDVAIDETEAALNPSPTEQGERG